MAGERKRDVGLALIDFTRKLGELSNFDVENVHIFGLLECEVVVVWALDEHVLNDVCHALCFWVSPVREASTLWYEL